jgi:hypothetical protein
MNIINTPSPQIIIQVQTEKMAKMQDELTLTQARLEHMSQYASILEQKVTELTSQESVEEEVTIEMPGSTPDKSSEEVVVENTEVSAE